MTATIRRAPRQEKVEAISKALEHQIGIVTDWAELVQDSLRDHNSDLESLVAEYMTKHKEAVDEGNEHMQAGAAAKKELGSVQQAHEVLARDLERTKEGADKQQKQMQSDIDRLRAELDNVRQTAFEEMQAERARAAKELQELRDRLSKELADAGASSSKALNDRIDAERARHEAEMQQLRAEMENAAKRAEAERLALEAQLKTLRDELNAAQAHVRDLTQKGDYADGNVRRLERELEQAQSRCKELQEALNTSEESLQVRS